MDARLRDGNLVWTVRAHGESRESMVDRAWFMAKGGSPELARCAVAVGHLDCGYDDAVMGALTLCSSKMYPEDNRAPNVTRSSTSDRG